MDPQPTSYKGLIIGIIIAIVVIAVVIFFVVMVMHQAPGSSSSPTVGGNSPTGGPSGGIVSTTFSQAAYQIALTRAHQWQSNAVPSSLNSSDPNGQVWDYMFASPSVKGEVFDVSMNGNVVVSAGTVPMSASGTSLPNNVVPADQAIGTTRAIPGYNTSSIQSAQLVYESAAKKWFWSFKMANGIVVSSPATQ